MDAEVRAKERNGAAIVRALGRSPHAEYRAHQLQVQNRPVAIATPYLLAAVQKEDGSTDRGVYDSIAVRLRHSDAELFAATEPDSPIARIVFDMLEQIRCESLVPDEFVGTRNNIEAAFRGWCQGQALSNTSVGLLVYTVMHMARSRLISPIHDELIEDEIESTRANISPIIGAALVGLRTHRADQAEYAIAARSLADAIDEMVSASMDEGDATAGTDSEATLLVPPEWGDKDQPEGDFMAGGTALSSTEQGPLETLGGYSIYTTEHDSEVRGEDLYSLERRRFIRRLLDEQVAAQSVSAFTLARRLRILFRAVERDGWLTGEEEGLLDAARLGQVVANPSSHAVFRQPRYRPTAPAVVSFLIDNSGSMKRFKRNETVAVLVDTLTRALDLAGATSEVLGFTTASWNGGEPRNEWRRAGEPERPGRLSATNHIVYKDADTPWKRSRLSVASLMRNQQFRESIDGEAIIWAYRRLMDRPEQRKLLVVVSDGAPTESSTRRAMGDTYLESHCRDVIRAIEREGRISLGAISIDQPVDALFANSVDMDLEGTLTLSEYRLLEHLFLQRR